MINLVLLLLSFYKIILYKFFYLIINYKIIENQLINNIWNFEKFNKKI